MNRLLIAAVIIGLFVGLSLAQICPLTPDGYVRQPRPQGQPTNYPPAGEPACFLRGTNEAANYIACYLCHDNLRRNAA